MESQNQGRGSVRRTISTTFERLKLQALAFRSGRSREPWRALTKPSPVIQGASCIEGSTNLTITCAHTWHSWFSLSPDSDNLQEDGEAESAQATLKELLAESVVFGRISAFYPPHPPPSGAEQALVRHRIAAEFNSRIRRKGGSSARRVPGPATPESRFTRFHDLPAEVRLQIWRAALPEHRTLHIGQKVGEQFSWTSRLPMPRLARVCRESREVVLSNVFPIYGEAPYRSGPGSSQNVIRRFITSWASSNDCLDLGATSLPAALRCGDYLDRVRDFRVVAQGLSSIFPSGLDNLNRGGEHSRVIPRGVNKLMVVVQVIFISLRPPSPHIPMHPWDNGDEPWLGPPEVLEVNDLISSGTFDVSFYDCSVYRRPKEHHISTIASLRDRARLKELLALGSVTGHWDDTGTRLRAMHHHSNAFCMDCLLQWWDKYALGAVRDALLSGSRTPYPNDGTDWEPSSDSLPELVPAVRFKIQWPGLEEHECMYQEDLKASCYA